MSNIYKHFDLPVKHLDGDFDYVPPKAREEAEIARRRALAPGTLLAEQQVRGCEVASRVVDYCIEHDDGLFSTRVLAATAMNTAWYNLARGARDVMRRRLYLPVHGRIEPITRGSLQTRASERLSMATDQADKVRRSIEGRHCTVARHRKELGVRLGDTSLLLASIERADKIELVRREAAMAQRITRQACLDALELSRDMHGEVGANPTLAQLADQDSPLSVYWRRNGSNEAVNALEAATSLEPAS